MKKNIKKIKINEEESPEYGTAPLIGKQEETINQALKILESRIKEKGDFMCNPKEVINFLKFKISELEHEVFSIMFLDNQHRLIKYKELFRGTINGSSVHPREILKEALKYNSSAVIIAHNHPSGMIEPSSADREITRQIKDSLELIDIRVLDHIIIGGKESFAFSERGYI